MPFTKVNFMNCAIIRKPIVQNSTFSHIHTFQWTALTEHASTAFSPIEEEPPKVISYKHLHPEKQYSPILSTSLGVRIDLIPELNKPEAATIIHTFLDRT
jgi:hypothetical protein